jgi:hypothetical protein
MILSVRGLLKPGFAGFPDLLNAIAEEEKERKERPPWGLS